VTIAYAVPGRRADTLRPDDIVFRRRGDVEVATRVWERMIWEIASTPEGQGRCVRLSRGPS
jgi:hypothetical protein